MNKIGIVAFAALFALVLGFGVRTTTQTAHAEATGSVVVGCEVLLNAIDGDPDDGYDGGDAADACDGISEAEASLISDAIGDEDGTLEVDDFEDVDLDDNQIEDNEGADARGFTYFIVFVDDDEPVTLDAPAGLNQVFTSPGGANSAAQQDFTCTDAVTDPAITDLDCDNTIQDDGDGVVFSMIIDASGDAGDELTINGEQEDEETSQEILITGSPNDIEVALVKTTVQVSGSTADVGDCVDDAEVAADNLEVNTSIAKATVTDNDDVELTRVAVVWDTEDPDIADVATDAASEGVDDPNGDSGITVHSDLGGIGSFIIVCGGSETGVAAIEGTINDGDADEESDEADITVVDVPASVALVAAPAIIPCDGTTTSTVTATVTDADGNNVADGVEVNFSVVALGTAAPINTTTTAGVSTSTITPLSGSTAGVTVLVTAGEGDDTAQASIRVDCSLPILVATAVANATATATTGSIAGPDTGNGGYLGQDSSGGVSAWVLIALAVGSVVLVGGGVVARRSAD